MNTTIKQRLEIISEFPFLIFFSVYFSYLLFSTSTFKLPLPPTFVKRLFFMLCFALIPRIPFLLKARKTHLLAALLMASTYYLVYKADGYSFLLFSGLFTVGFFGIDYRKIMKLYTIVLGCFLILTFSAACCGAIQDYVYLKDGYIRSSLGICYPTDMSSYVLFLLMYSWAVWRKIPDLVAVILGIICFYFSKYIAMSVTSTIVSILFFATVFCHFLCVECGLSKRLPKIFVKYFKALMVLAFPLFGILMFLLIFLYAKEFNIALRLNVVLSDRLKLPLESYHKYGIKAFGSPLPQIGNGFSSFKPLEYIFVDSTYPLILLRYGWVLFIMLCTSWSFCTKRAFLNKDSRLACLFVLIAFHSFSEHHFTEINFNPLVVMPFTAFLPVPYEVKQPQEHVPNDIFRSIKILVLIMTVSLIIALILPHYFTWMRTIIQLHDWTGGGKNGFLVLRTLSGIYILVALFLLSGIIGGRYFLSFLHSKKKHYYHIVLPTLVMLSSLFLLSHIWFSGNQLISDSVSEYHRQLLADQNTLSLITKSSTGKVYIDNVPSIYQQIVPGISDSVFCGDELARFYNTSVITDWTNDSSCFINSGFLFTRISRFHALYTNDNAVIRALKENGIHLTGYYNAEKSINLSYLSRLNNLLYSKRAGLSLNGNDHSLQCGPYISLYSGQYTVEYELQLNDVEAAKENMANNEIAMLRISAYNGKLILKEHVISKDQFNENGHALLKIPFNSENYSDIEFLAFPEGNHSFQISSIRYYRSPQYDIHMLYNKKRQRYREEYYTLDGIPTESTGGFSSVEYGYDPEGRITDIHYYDMNNAPAILSTGYSSLKRQFDARGRVVWESYFGPNSEPVLCSNGYASTFRSYNSDTEDVSLQKYYGLNGESVRTIWLYAEIHRRYNDRHQIILESYYDTDGSPFTMPTGQSMIESQYDSSGRAHIQRYLNASGNPVITTYGYAEIHREFTPQNWVSKESYYGIDGEPLSLPAGYAMIRRDFDERGNATLTEYCAADGSRIMTTMHYSALIRRFNDRNHIIYEGYLDIDDNPATLPGNYAAVEYERNSIGDAISFKYYDQTGTFAPRSEGYAEILRDYDDKRNPIRDIYLDTEGNPVITTMQYAEIHRSYNDMRQITSESYFDLKGNPCSNTSGFHKIKYEYDTKNLVTSFRYFDTFNLPIEINWGYFEERRSYNLDGSIAAQQYFNILGDEVFEP